MTLTYGLLPTGFVRITFPDIFSERYATYNSRFGPNLKSTGDSVAGNIIAIESEREAIIWEQLEAVYLAGCIQYANDEALDNVVARVLVSRILARNSTVNLELASNSDSPVTILAGSLVKQSATGTQWETIETVIIPPNDVVACKAKSVEKGPFTADEDTINTIISLQSGWVSVTNTDEAVPGRIRETDAELRKRALNKHITSSGGIGAAIANRLLTEVTGVTYVAWEENRTAAIVDGMAPHSFRFTISGGDDDEIARKIMDTGGIGIQTNGDDVSVSVSHDYGPNITIKFNRTNDQDIYLIVNKTTNGDYPATGDDLIVSLLVEYGANFENGDPVINHYLVGALNGIPGLTFLEILQGTSDPPSTTITITVSGTQRANITADNIVVNTV
jgi:uncharacterized phage protein gp47/JayE